MKKIRLIIAGGRDEDLTPAHIEALDQIRRDFDIIEVVSGHAKGIDRRGEEWAESRGIKVKRFLYPSHMGSRGGPYRNAQMAVYASAVALFPGGKGTQNMREKAKQIGLLIFEHGA